MTTQLETPATTRKAYPEEFKREAVELLRTSGRPTAQIARELGVSADSLRVWRKQAEREAPEPAAKRTRLWVLLGVAGVAVAAAVLFLLLPLAGWGGDDGPDAGQAEQAAKTGQAFDGSFVGEVSGTEAFVAVVAEPAADNQQNRREVQIYLADGRRLSEWFVGSISGNSFTAKSDDGDAQAKGKLSGDSVTGTLELPGGKTVRYEASPPSGAAGVYVLTVSSDGDLSGTSAAGLGVTGEMTLRKKGTGMLRLVDGERLEFDVTRRPAGDLLHLRAGQFRLIVLADGEMRGAGQSRPSAGGHERDFFIFG